MISRQAGMDPGFGYSTVLRRSGPMRNGQTQNRWLRDTRAAVPTTGMLFEGLESSARRRDVIAFLEHEDAPR
jgi:cytochrome c2